MEEKCSRQKDQEERHGSGGGGWCPLAGAQRESRVQDGGGHSQPPRALLLLLLQLLSRFHCVRFVATPWTEAHQAPLSMGFSRQEYWSGVPLASPPRDLCALKLGGSQPCDEWQVKH